MDRRNFLFATLASGLGAVILPQTVLANSSKMEVFKSPTCGCCSAWVEYMISAGFDVVMHDVDQNTLRAIKARAGVTQELSSCHTAFISGYFIEGHVRAEEVHRLLSERPNALGLSVPGMPIGSPGMEMGDQRDTYDTLLVLKNGSTEVFYGHSAIKTTFRSKGQYDSKSSRTQSTSSDEVPVKSLLTK